ncbi:anaerobic sulfite reductase subunit A [Cetobacterium ceti]|uniref:Anaerobic sulfite reductase subunit A n=1 Tax=Cetobacterium ceti TaxID=180163 RepID=A0A1T4MJA6_9FUSO|nr:4Fe-4S dicluster domain-containing protein [Cetobacterium ceti]SJZ67052.1 anaerobic sulfite reductase subunit A [Cetobacterium ceti]
MNIKVSQEQMDGLLLKLSEKYKILAPKAFKNEGRYSYDDDIRYGEISTFDEIIFNKKSSASPKEVLLPINHTLSVTIGNTTVDTTEDKDERDILIFLHPCDIHGISRIDNTFQGDSFYENRRKKMKFVMIECIENGWDNCFCTCLNTNKSNNYSFGIKVKDNEILIKSQDDDFNIYFQNEEKVSENIEMYFVEENKIDVKIPHIESWDKMTLDKVKNLEFWNEYSNRCIGCGSCNMACLTCTCMPVVKVTNSENENIVERKRIWSGCQLVKSASLKNSSLSKIVLRE